MLEICALASGSNGNCYYIGNKRNAVLVDAGISCKQIIQRMEERGIDSNKIKAIFITHEHSDHSRGARVLGKRLQVPIYITAKTFNNLYKKMRPASPIFFEPDQTIESNEFKIHSFLKNHDAAEPCSFRIEYEGKNIGVFTDIGEPCENVTSHINLCHALFLESNYDEDMLINGSYPFFLKKRVSSSVGHLSNKQALELIQKHGGKNLSTIFLSHLSKDNNSPEKAMEAFEPISKDIDVKLTSRHEAGEVCYL